jgi:hypothetical protein
MAREGKFRQSKIVGGQKRSATKKEEKENEKTD